MHGFYASLRKVITFAAHKRGCLPVTPLFVLKLSTLCVEVVYTAVLTINSFSFYRNEAGKHFNIIRVVSFTRLHSELWSLVEPYSSETFPLIA